MGDDTYEIDIKHERRFLVVIELPESAQQDLPPTIYYKRPLHTRQIRFMVEGASGRLETPRAVSLWGQNIRADGSHGAWNSRPLRREDSPELFMYVDRAMMQIEDEPWPELVLAEG